MKKCAMFAILALCYQSEMARAVSAGVTAQSIEKKGEKSKDKPKPKPAPPTSLPPRDDDKGHHHHRDDDRNRDDDRYHPRPVIIERPVYIPSYPPSYPYPYPYSRDDGNREAELLEAVGKQMRFALRENEVLKPFKLDTDTVGDSVEIHGTVDTVAQLQLALDVARAIDPNTRIVITRIKVRQK